MEWGSLENCVVAIGQQKCDCEKGEIFRMLSPLKVTRNFVYRTVKLFADTGDMIDRAESGRPRTARTLQAIKAVEVRIRRNPLRKQKIISREMNISKISMSRILKRDLGLYAYKRHTSHLLTEALQAKRKSESEELRRQYAKNAHRRITITDEKIFTVEESFNKQNGHSSHQASQLTPRVQRCHHPTSVMAPTMGSLSSISAKKYQYDAPLLLIRRKRLELG